MTTKNGTSYPLMFSQWLSTQRDRDTPVGDLARDVTVDRQAPTGQTTRRQWWEYLQARHACDGALEALEQAWRSYARAMQRAAKAQQPAKPRT